LRLLDIAAALGARRYAVPGELVLEVRDEDPGGFAAGRYRLRADGDDVECRRSDADPDLTISQRTLASIYLGGFRLRQLALAGGATEHTPGAVDRLDVMCSTPLAPWNGTWF
jgi:predicted acetyltransferase